MIPEQSVIHENFKGGKEDDIMKKKMMSLLLAVAMCMSCGAAVFLNEDNQEATLKDISVVQAAYHKSEDALRLYSEENNINIVIEDADGNTLSEYHTDGLTAQFYYSDESSITSSLGTSSSKRLKEITDNLGRRTTFSYAASGDIDEINVYQDDKHIETRVYNSPDNAVLSTAQTQASYTPFYVYHKNGTSTNMSELFEDNSKFLRCTKCPGVSAIQNIFEENDSPLKDRIDVYVNDGGTITWSQTIVPSQNIHDISIRTNVAPKVILATLQKESSLVSGDSGNDYTKSYFYFCMGAGSNTSASYTGFPNQIRIGAETLYKHYNTGLSFSYPYLYSHSGFRGYHGYGTSGYDTQIWVANAATYSLYKYTPYTCQNNSSTYTANVAFKDIYYSTTGCLASCAQ